MWQTTHRNFEPVPYPVRLWCLLAGCSLGLAAFGLVWQAFWPAIWQAQTLRDVLLLGYAVPAGVALGSWLLGQRGGRLHLAPGPYADLHYVLLAWWSVIAVAIAIAHGWAHRPWLTGYVPAGLSLVLGSGALAPIAAAALAPASVRRP
jgi:hypothetical protein